jgi:ribonuclease HI
MPRPVPTDEITKKLLNEVWKCKAMIPRVKTFVWRLLRKAISTSDRVARYSKHIENLCCRCGLPEDDFHLFFNCPFARAAWFHEPWFIRADFFTQNSSSFAQIILNLLAINHPYANLLNICTFLWCLWKARNEELFCRKKGRPYQIALRSRALLKDLEMVDTMHTTIQQYNPSSVGSNPLQGASVPTDFVFTGPKIYTDAAWKKRGNSENAAAGLGIYFHVQDQDAHTDVFIRAKSLPISSAIQAEAQAMLLAAQFAYAMNLQNPVFFTDNSSLARAVASVGAKDPAMLWEIRRQAIQFQNLTRPLHSTVYHISREINGVAHCCAHQAKRSFRSQPTSSCRNTAHGNLLCPVLAAVGQLQPLGSVILSVECF